MELNFNGKVVRLFILAVFPFSHIFAQVEISKPEVEVVDNKMIISYEISGRSEEDTVNVSLNITDSLGNKIEPKALTGDVGKNIGTGTAKKIIWDLKMDSFYVDMNIRIRIVADVIKPPEIIAVKEEDTAQEIVEKKDTGIEHTIVDSSDVKTEQVTDLIEEDEMIETDIPAGTKSQVSVGKIAMFSAIFPGWGLTKLSQKKPYWLLGVAGAGCIAGSVYYNHQAYSNYEKYTNASDARQMNSFYDDAEKQQKISGYLAISAVAIWIADIGVASLRAASINKKAKSERSKITLDWNYNTVSESPMLSIIYQF